MNEKAIELVALFNHEQNRSANFRNLYQQVADLEFPRESEITQTKSEGQERGQEIIDPTGVMASIEMASGLSINLFPPGQKFYNITMSDRRLNSLDSVRRTLGLITEISHEKRANSNFVLQANETLRSISVFGTGCMFSEYVPSIGLNYTDYDIGQYIIRENSKGRVDTVMMKFPYTARQAYQEWGDKAGETIIKAMEDEKKKEEKFYFIWIVRPRGKRNPQLQDNMNMPFESVFINITDKEICKESGFEEFPFAVPRWFKSSSEVWGRGQGVFALPAVRGLQTIKKDLLECGNKWNNPALETLESFEGEVRTYAGAINSVTQIGSIRAIDQGVRGNFPITREVLEMEQELVRKMFYNDVFVQLGELRGDRRTTVEITERLREGLNRLAHPIGRLQEEWLNPMVTRDILLLIRNGEVPPLPPEMQGQSFKIEYVGRLAMELKSQQSRGFQEWLAIGAQVQPIFPSITDNINLDGGYRRLGETLGVSVEDMNSEEDMNAIRQQRAQKEQAVAAMQAAQVGADAISKTSKAPEEGSPAEMMMNV